MTVNFRDYLNERLKDPSFRAEYEAQEVEDEILQAIILERKSKGITEEELSKRSGLKQSEIKELEGGQTEPTLKILHQMAFGVGKKLRLELVSV